jgi:hypothetical protein
MRVIWTSWTHVWRLRSLFLGMGYDNVEAHEEPESINWLEFRAAFCAHHVPQWIIKLKKKEFQDLKWGPWQWTSMSPSSLNCLAMLQMKWTLTRWSKTIFWLAWMMDWPMLWRPRILRTFKGWWTRLLCWRTADVWWCASVSWCVNISRAVAPDHVSSHHQLDLCSILLNHSFNLGHSQLDKDSLLSSVKWFSAPTISRLLLLGIRMFRELKLLWTQCSLDESAMLVARRVILPTNAPTYALIPRQLHLHLHLPVEPTLFLLLPSRTMHVGESTILLWRKPKKLQTLLLVCFSSMTLL